MKPLKALAIDLKKSESVSDYLKYSLRYLPEFLIAFLTGLFLIIIASPGPFYTVLFSVLFTAASVISVILLGRKRFNDIKSIRVALSNIKNNEIIKSEDIKLSPALGMIQDELTGMYTKISNDIVYLKKLEQVRKEFLGNVSHELKTPIFAITGYLETLLNGAINDQNVSMHFLNKAFHHTENLSHLLNDLIDISRIESGEMRMSFRYFNLKQFLTDLIPEFQEQAEKKGIELILHPVRKGLQVFGDKSRLQQVFNNLIQNAIKYTPEGRVEITVTEFDNNVLISVKDTGLGIPEEDISRVFERFYRVDKARSREIGGTGLGLAITKHILEAHNSKIDVRSEYGKGSEFFFRLAK